MRQVQLFLSRRTKICYNNYNCTKKHFLEIWEDQHSKTIVVFMWCLTFALCLWNEMEACSLAVRRSTALYNFFHSLSNLMYKRSMSSTSKNCMSFKRSATFNIRSIFFCTSYICGQKNGIEFIQLIRGKKVEGKRIIFELVTKIFPDKILPPTFQRPSKNVTIFFISPS